MRDILSVWRSPIDQVALSEADALFRSRPRCSIGYNEDFSQMTAYNYGYYVTAAMGDTDMGLTNMFDAMNPNLYGNNGGSAFIPQLTYAVDATAGGFSVPDQCDISGSGGGGKAGSGPRFYHFKISGTGGSGGGPGYVLFKCAGSYTSGGKYFRSLSFQWTDSSNPNDTCIVGGTWNCRAVNCTFIDCPVAFNAAGQSCALEQCTVQYTQGPDSTKAVIIAGPQCAVLGPAEFEVNGPSGCTGISIEGPADHAFVANLHIYHWNFGIDFSQMAGSQYSHIRDCEISCEQTAVNIQLPANAESAITAGIKITSCFLNKETDSTADGPIVAIDPQLTSTYNDNSQLNDITLTNCTVFSQATHQLSGQHGLEILGGSNIKVIGGTYSNNGKDGGAGIAITGACGDVQIIAANMQPSYPKSENPYAQEYALVVSGGPVGTVLVSNCDMTGYGAGPVSVSGPAPHELLIYNCPGYNDVNTLLNGSVGAVASVNAATCTTPYFGPSVIIFSNPTPLTLHVFGQAMTRSSGIIFLPSPYDSFFFSALPSVFSWIGK